MLFRIWWKISDVRIRMAGFCKRSYFKSGLWIVTAITYVPCTCRGIHSDAPLLAFQIPTPRHFAMQIPSWTKNVLQKIRRSWGNNPKYTTWGVSRWWFQIFFFFTPIWGRFPIWLIFFRWVETTNQVWIHLGLIGGPALFLGPYLEVFFAGPEVTDDDHPGIATLPAMTSRNVNCIW